MSGKLDELVRRREILLVRSGGQRERLAESSERLARSLRWAHIAKGIVQKIKDNPAALLGATAFIGGSLFRAFRARRARRRA